MERNKILIVVLLVLMADSCFAGIVVKTGESVHSTKLIDAAIYILTTCYPNQRPIAISGEVPENLLAKIWSRKEIPVMLLPGDMNFGPGRVRLYSNEKPEVFLVPSFTVSEAIQRTRVLYNVIGFNPSTPYLILYISPNGCKGYMGMLLTFLTIFDLMTVNVLCMPDPETMVLLTPNPHTNYAPSPWQLQRTYNNAHGFKFFLFNRTFSEDSSTCDNLDYDKTKDLGGKRIPFVDPADITYERRMGKRMAKPGYLTVRDSTIHNMHTILLRQLNAKKIIHHHRNMRFTNVKNTDHLATCFITRPFDLSRSTGFPTIYPVMRDTRAICTGFRGYKSQLEKILSIIDVYSQICIGLTLLLTIVVFKTVAHQHIVPAVLNVVRMLCNTGFVNLTLNQPMRAYLVCLSVLIVTMHGIFAGDLAALLTTDILFRHPRTMEDLVEMNYFIEIDGILDYIYNDPQYKEFSRILSHGCAARAARNLELACIDSRADIVDAGKVYDVYVSKEDLFPTYLYFVTGYKFYLTERTNRIFSALISSHTTKTLRMRVWENRLEEYDDYLMNRDLGPQVLKLQDLTFAFIILVIGLGFAVIIFVIEISIEPVRASIARVRALYTRGRVEQLQVESTGNFATTVPAGTRS